MELFDMNLIEYTRYGGFELAELVRGKQITPKELSQLFIQAVEKVNSQINSVVKSMMMHWRLPLNQTRKRPSTGFLFCARILVQLRPAGCKSWEAGFSEI
jgi:hypothetical protein